MEIYKMIYKIEKFSKTLRIVGEKFAKKNRQKGILIINNKKSSLKDVIPIKEITKIKILMILSKPTLNKSCMFKDCKSLESLSLLSIDSDSNHIKNEEHNLNTTINTKIYI